MQSTLLAPEMLLFTLLAVVSFSAASNRCRLELESITFDPQTYSQNYLKILNARLAQYSELLFTSQGSAIIASFEQEYGVSIALQSPFPSCAALSASQTCYSTTQLYEPASSLTFPFPFNISESGSLSSMSISNLTVRIGPARKSMLDETYVNVYLQPPGGSVSTVLQSNCRAAYGLYQFGLADTSLIPFDCTNLDSGTIFQPTTPFSQFNGLEAAGEWNLIINGTDYGSLQGFTIDYCIASCSLSSDFARANLNIPGYRYDSANAMVYYTSVLRNIQSEELYVTISRSVKGMFVKK